MLPRNAEFSRCFAISRLPYAPVSGILLYDKFYVYRPFWESETGEMESVEMLASSDRTDIESGEIDRFLYGDGRQIVTDIPRILTAEHPFVELRDLRYGWCDMRFGEIKIPSVSYITDPLYDTMSMFIDFFGDGHGEMTVDHEGDLTDIAIDAVDYEVYGLAAKISIASHCGVRSVSDTVRYDAAVVSAYGLVSSLIDNLDGWADWSYCETEDERRDAIREYVEKAGDMISSARTAIGRCEGSGMYDGDIGKSAMEYINGSIDTAEEIIDSISID